MADGGGGFTLHPKQLEAVRLLSGTQLYSLLVGGSRSGKTFKLVRAVVIRALRARDSRHVIFRLRYNALRASIWLDTLPKVLRLCFPGVTVKHNRQDGYVEFANGSQIWFCGLDDAARVEKVLGLEFVTVYFNECSQIPYSSVLVGLTRLAQKVAGLLPRAYFDLNPVGTGHWTYALFIEKLDPITRKKLTHPESYVYLYMNPADNKDNLDDHYLEMLAAMPEKQRRRFLDGRYVAEVDGALWTLEGIEQQRILPDEVPKDLDRIVVALDPSGCSGKENKRSDEVGIIVCGRKGTGGNAQGYVLADLSGRYAPEKWGQLATSALHTWGGDCIIGEINYGGDMVRAVIQGQDANAPFKMVTATRGKVVRAEPISQLYTMKRVYHAGMFERLEDQMCNFSTAGYMGEKSPDRADAAVWGLSELMLSESTTGLLDYYRAQAAEAEAAKQRRKEAR